LGFLSKLFGKSDGRPKGARLDPQLTRIFQETERLLEDDDAQLELLHPELREALKRAPYYNKDPNGTGPFGLCKTNPIPVNGPIGELAYLSRLLTIGGERLLFHRLGSIDEIDVYEAVTFSGGQWFIFFLDMYHPRKSTLAPKGFKLSRAGCQFSGFNKYCNDFPYDFVEARHQEWEHLGPAYMSTQHILDNIRTDVYQRPAAHKAQLQGLRFHRRSAFEDSSDDKPPASMIDYYSLVTNFVSRLDNNTSEARERLYARAQHAIVTQLQARDPPASDAEIMREQRALAAAIHRVEDEASQKRIQDPTASFESARHVPPPPPGVTAIVRDKPQKANVAANTIKSVGMIVLAIVGFAALIILPSMFILGAAWVSEHLIEYLASAVAFSIIPCLFILSPLALFRKTRFIAAYGFLIFSYLCGATTWALGLLTTLDYWGLMAAAIGLFFAGVGVVPLGIVASAFHADWWSVGGLSVGLFVTFSVRMLSLWLADTAKRS